VVQGDVEGCLKGASITGSRERPIRDVVLRGSYCRNGETGVTILNASNVAVIGARIEENADCGILISGKIGGRNCLVADCSLLNNGAAIRRTSGSDMLCYFPEPHDADTLFSSGINLQALQEFSDEEVPRIRRTPWFARG
jgi:hypothetical protein